jgi:hypothetical protein
MKEGVIRKDFLIPDLKRKESERPYRQKMGGLPNNKPKMKYNSAKI